VTLALVQAERSGAEAWAQRNGWEIEFLLDRCQLKGSTKHPADAKPLWLTADLSGYKAIPPAWRFVNREGVEEKSAYPAPGPVHGKASIFHSNPVICAPFNRLSYKDGDGPHASDWGDAVRWSSISGDFATPKTLADMLMVIDTHLAFSPGRQ
jgi:hypothetical protein